MRRLAIIAAAAIVACASPRPKFYPNDRYPSIGEAQAQKDTDECLAEAKQYLKDTPFKPVAKNIGWGAATGAAIGAVVGAITGDFGGALASGAAAGGAGGAIQGTAEASSPDAVVRAYTNRCLATRGYEILGWR